MLASSHHTHEICPNCWGVISPDAEERDKCKCKERNTMTTKYGSPTLYGKLLNPPLSKKQVNLYLNKTPCAVRGAQHMPKTVDGSKKGNWIVPINPLAPDPRRKRETA